MNLAGKNLTETFVSYSDDFWAPYTNTGGLNQAATLTLFGATRNISVTEGVDAFSGSGNAISVVIAGVSDFVFGGAGAYTGGTTIDGGELTLAADDSVGSGAITFGANAHATLTLDSPDFLFRDLGTPTSIPDATDAIDFAQINYMDGEHLALLSSGTVSTYALESAGDVTLGTLLLTGAFNPTNLIVAPKGESAQVEAVYSAAAAASAETAILNSITTIAISDTASGFNSNRAAIETLIDDNMVSALYVSGVTLTDKGPYSVLSVFGGDDGVTLADDSHLSMYNSSGAWNVVDAVSGTIALDNANASIFGGDDTINLANGGGEAVSVYGSASSRATINGSAATIYSTDSITTVAGGADTVYMRNVSSQFFTLNLDDTLGYWDLVQATESFVNLNGAQASVAGGDDRITLNNTYMYQAETAASSVSLYGTNGVADQVTATNDWIYLNASQAQLSGPGDAILFNGGGNALTIENGYAYSVFNAGIGGQETIGGFGATDSLTFSHTDFANFTALSSHLTQSGANAVITLNASNTVTLTGVQASNLTAAEFSFY